MKIALFLRWSATALVTTQLVTCTVGDIDPPADAGSRTARASATTAATAATTATSAATLRLHVMARPRPAQLVPETRCAMRNSGMVGTQQLNSEAATYLGSGTADSVNAVEIAADCSVLVAGKLGALAGVSAPQPLVQGVASSTGLLVEAIYEGRAIRRQRNFGTVINDLSTNATRDVLIGGDAGLVRLGANLQTVLWSKTSLGAATRVALANDGTAAALFGKTLRVFDAQGNELGSRSFGDSAVNDVAIDGSTVYVTGLAQRDGGACSQLQVAWVRAYPRNAVGGAERWKAWDWTHAQAAGTDSSCADTRGIRVAIGNDGGLYFAGESAGGNTIYRFQSVNLATAAPNVSTDPYNSAYNTASNHITYIAKLDPSTGAVQKGQLVLARLSSTKGNTIRPTAITADAQGRVYVAGVSACCLQNRDTFVFNGATLAAYAGGDPFVLVLSSDLRTRYLWFSAANGGKGEAQGIATFGGLTALGSRADAVPMTLDRAVQSSWPAGATSNGHLLTWSTAP